MKRRSLLGLLAGVFVPLPMISAKEARRQEAAATGRLDDIFAREAERIQGDIYYHFINQCPWISLIPKQPFPTA